MGVAAFFRWISRKYPKIITPALEEEPESIDGIEQPIIYSDPNPNGELDNLYLDMNGIVHPCTHPEGRPPPQNEAEMMAEIFRYTERVINIARPRKVLMIAVDGVAPRAKINQQRSRRFRSAQEAKLAEEAKQEELLRAQSLGGAVETTEPKKAWDTNVITPGTPFMDLLASSLRYWISYKLQTDPGWKDLHVILSDASVPGEGEHKVMEYIRSQRNDPAYDPNTSHCIYGLDADLIFLGLATHEPNFKVLREDVFQQNKTAKLNAKKPYIYLNLDILREYLEIELDIPNTGFPFDLERALDDWVFMAFFCGNDFLPHLPSLDVRENGIDVLTRAWRRNLHRMHGYITLDGKVNLGRAQMLLRGVAAEEDGILQRAASRTRYMQNRNNQNRHEPRAKISQNGNIPLSRTRGEQNPVHPVSDIPLFTPKGEVVNDNPPPAAPASAPIEATSNNNSDKSVSEALESGQRKRKLPDGSDAADETGDVKLGEYGYHERYYMAKFGVSDKDADFMNGIIQKYIEGICWVLEYYYQGCPSWSWYYPYHYAPFAQDLVSLDGVKVVFEQCEPFRPFEQLMSVLPAASGHALPEVFRDLMSNPDSPIIDFYPEDFEIDLNGKRQLWQGVVLLPFIDEKRLFAAIKDAYTKLTEAEKDRNSRKEPEIYTSGPTALGHTLKSLYEGDAKPNELVLSCQTGSGTAGTYLAAPNFVYRSELSCPVEIDNYENLSSTTYLCATYLMPEIESNKSMLLQDYTEVAYHLSYEDRDGIISRRQRSDRGDERDKRDFRSGDDYVEPRALDPSGYLGSLQQAKRVGHGSSGVPQARSTQGDRGGNNGYRGYQGYQGYQGNQGGYQGGNQGNYQGNRSQYSNSGFQQGQGQRGGGGGYHNQGGYQNQGQHRQGNNRNQYNNQRGNNYNGYQGGNQRQNNFEDNSWRR